MKNLYILPGKERLSKGPAANRNDLIIVDLEDLSGAGRTLFDKAIFEKQYIDLIASLAKNAGSIYWWASGLSEKNAFTSDLFAILYKFEYASRVIENSGGKDVAVICPDPVICGQLARNYAQDFNIHSSQPGGLSGYFHDVMRLASGLVRNINAAIAEYKNLLLSRYMLGQRKNSIKKGSSFVVIRTWADHRNYKQGSYEDPYFKGLVKHISSRGKQVLIFAGTLSGHRMLLEKFKSDPDNLIIPVNLYLKGFDVSRSLFASYFLRPTINWPVFFNRRDITLIISAELRKDITNTRFFAALIQYYSSLRLARNVPIERFIYTFENYAWEKLSIMGLRQGRKGVKIVGFQHAFIPKNNFSYFPGKAELGTMPFPDTIITMGKRTEDIMKRSGSYPKDIFTTGCALRQDYLTRAGILPRQTNKDVFVPLTITVEDTARALKFLLESDLPDRPGKVYLRFHPATSIDKVMRRVARPLPGNFAISENPPIEEELKRCSVVLYTWTTVCLEAVKMGRPAIYMDVNFPFEVDPLFECPYLKRSVSSPKDLAPMIDGICGMDESSFREELAGAQDYLKTYFSPVTQQGMDEFLK